MLDVRWRGFDIRGEDFVNPKESDSLVCPCIGLDTVNSSFGEVLDLSFDSISRISFVDRGGNLVPSAQTVKQTVTRPTDVFISLAFTVLEPLTASVLVFESLGLNGV